MGLEWKKLHLWRLWLSQDYPKKTLLVVKSRKGSAWSIAIRHDSFCIQSLGQKIHGMQKKQLLPVSLLVSTLQLPFASPKCCKIAITSGFGVQKICLQLGASPRFPHLCSSQYPRRSWSQFVFKSPFLWCEVHPSCSKKKCLVKPPFLLGKIAIFDYSKIHVPSSWFRQPSPRGTAPLVNSERLLWSPRWSSWRQTREASAEPATRKTNRGWYQAPEGRCDKNII